MHKLPIILISLAFLTNAAAAQTYPKDSALPGDTLQTTPTVSEDLPAWAQHLQLEHSFGEKLKAETGISTVAPLYESQDDAIFGLGRLAYGRLSRTTGNLEAGYVHTLLDNALLIGIDGFYDYEWPYDHQRIGAGVQLKTRPVDLNANTYNAFTGWGSGDGTFSERAMDGRDVELGLQVPYVPWARVYGRKFYYDAIGAGNNMSGNRLSLQLTPFDIVQVEVARVDDNYNDAAYAATMRLSFAFGSSTPPATKYLADKEAWRFEDISNQRYDQPRREYDLRLQRRAPASVPTVPVSRGN